MDARASRSPRSATSGSRTARTSSDVFGSMYWFQGMTSARILSHQHFLLSIHLSTEPEIIRHRDG